MNKILVIAKKEFLDTFRDKRTLIRMILIPLIAFPVIIQLITKLQSSQAEKEAGMVLKVAYYENTQGLDIIDRLKSNERYEYIAYQDTNKIKEDVISKEVNLGLYFGEDFQANFQNGKQANYWVVMKGAEREEYERFEEELDHQDSILLSNRMVSVGKEYSFTEPTNKHIVNLSTLKETIAKYAGGMLPYIFIAFLFMGCMLPAIDMFAGEKERGTIETLLTSPVNRLQILLGKMTVITAMGLISATFALIGLFVSLNMVDSESLVIAAVNEMLTVQLMATLYILLIPLAIFFAGVMIPISVYSRSFKEAQSILTPLNIVMVLPAMVGFVPGVELDYTTAFIPIVNVVLATKAIIAGNFDIVLLSITFISLILLAAISVFVSMKQFDKETNILR
jgi:sodium transport system permease protein